MILIIISVFLSIFFTMLIIWGFYIDHVAMVCPKKGSFIGWKCAYKTNPLFEGGVKIVLIKLEIPEDAKRSSAPHKRKCRCNKAKVLEIVVINKGEPTEEFTDVAYSMHDPSFIYKVEKEVSVDNFCEDRRIECAPGIHFFMEKEEALRYIQ